MRRFSLCLLLTLQFAACGSGKFAGTVDGGQDGGADAGTDAGSDVGLPEPVLVLRGATVFPASGEGVLTGQVVTVRGERIDSVLPDTGQVPANATVIDLDGLFLMPGLIDNHVHIATYDLETVPDTMETFLDWGVTSVKDVCSRLDEILDLRDQIARGETFGPRIVAVGPAFTAPDGHPAATMWPGQDDLIANALRLVQDPDLARQEVGALAAAGVDQIKCVMTDCFGNCARMDPAVLDAIVDEAHALGFRVMVHTDDPADVTAVLDANADGVEHGFVAGPPQADQLQRLVQQGVFVVPTLSVVKQYAPVGLDGLINHLEMLRLAGVMVALGTDADNGGVPYGESVHQELGYFEQTGYSPTEAHGRNPTGSSPPGPVRTTRNSGTRKICRPDRSGGQSPHRSHSHPEPQDGDCQRPRVASLPGCHRPGRIRSQVVK